MLSVVAEHTAIHALSPTEFPGSILRCGRQGVDLFFVISGFCLAYPTLARIKSDAATTFDVAAFAARRIVRIVPPYYAAIALLVLGAVAVGRHVDATDVIYQLLFWDGRGQAHMLNYSFWTLPIEFRWYIYFPILLWVWTRSKPAVVTIGVIAYLLAQTRAANVDFLTLPAFILGIAAADLFCNGFKNGAIALTGSVFLAVVGYFTSPWDYNNYALLSWQAAAFLLIVSVPGIPLLERLLSSAPLRFVGFTSYSIYLVHAPVMEFLEKYGANGVVCGLGGVAAGIAFWFVAERPFVQGSIRRRLLLHLDAVMPRWLAFAGIGSSVVMGTKSSKSAPAIASALLAQPSATQVAAVPTSKEALR